MAQPAGRADVSSPPGLLRVSLLAVPMSVLLLPLILMMFVAPIVIVVFRDEGGRVGPAALVPLALVVLGGVALFLEAILRVHVGADGLAIGRLLRPMRFVPFADIERVEEVDGTKVRLLLRSGESIQLVTNRDANLGKPTYVGLCDRLLARIQEGVERAKRREEPGAESALRDAMIAQASRNPRKSAESTYRDPGEAPGADAAIEVLGDPTADPVTRAAAAVVLRRGDRRRAGPVLLRIADETAEPEMRRFLSLTAEPEGEEQAVDEAFAELRRKRT